MYSPRRPFVVIRSVLEVSQLMALDCFSESYPTPLSWIIASIVDPTSAVGVRYGAIYSPDLKDFAKNELVLG
ncbi:unannotated protein [freshwater metagenome]|uniref:Unannotated protein n=1 Tax=freshwater metagenome TaxID=449393 RepID=A0A6J6N6Q7_9ZZZZ